MQNEFEILFDRFHMVECCDARSSSSVVPCKIFGWVYLKIAKAFAADMGHPQTERHIR